MYLKVVKRCLSGGLKTPQKLRMNNFLLQSCLCSHFSEQLNSPGVIKQNVFYPSMSIHTSASFKDNKSTDTRTSRVMTTVRLFTKGMKLMYYEGRQVYATQKKAGGYLDVEKGAPTMVDGKLSVPYSSKDLQLAFRLRRDMKMMLPTIAFFMIPFIGYLAPLVAFMYPDKMLSRHFWPPSMRDKVQAELTILKTFVFRKLHGKLGANVQSKQSKPELSFMTAMKEQFLQFSRGSNPENAMPIEPPQAYTDIKTLPSDHRTLLFRGWGVGRLTLSRLHKLELHLKYIFTSDWLMKLEGGVKDLSWEELKEACIERGLGFDHNRSIKAQTKEMNDKLERWIATTTQYKTCPTLLLAYLPVAQYQAKS